MRFRRARVVVVDETDERDGILRQSARIVERVGAVRARGSHRKGELRRRVRGDRSTDGEQGRDKEGEERVRSRERRDADPARGDAVATPEAPRHCGGVEHHVAAEPEGF